MSSSHSHIYKTVKRCSFQVTLQYIIIVIRQKQLLFCEVHLKRLEEIQRDIYRERGDLEKTVKFN